MSVLRDRMAEGVTIVLDGGLGTALMAMGLPRGTPPEQWNLERGDAVTAAHRAYVAAGAEVVHANTFGANPVRLAAFGLENECARINRSAVTLARAAMPRFVFGDVGPTGEYLPPIGKGDVARWRDAFTRQAHALADAGVDALHIETMSDLREARVALDALLTAAPGVPVLVSMTFDRKKRGYFTVMGNAAGDALRALLADGATAVGANCSVASGDMTALMSELEALNAPLVAQPNAGTPCVGPDGTLHYAQTADEFATDMVTIARRGVTFAGGCCGTDHHFIAALSMRLRS